MDNLYQDLNINSGSVHLSNYPIYNEKLVDKVLERKIRLSQEICSLALSLRKKEKIKVRQPLPKILVPFKNQDDKNTLIEISEFIKSEINVKEIELISDSSSILIKKAKPNFKVLGPKFGKDLKEVVNQINSLDNVKINAIDDGELVKISLNNLDYNLSSDDVEIYFEDIEGWLVASENGKTIALDTSINESLKNEGISREIVNRIQNLRKESNFNVSDKIIIELERNNLIEKAIFANLNYVKNETLAKDLIFLDNLDSTTKIEFDDFSLGVKIFKINKNE
jgi:isoleucyl-tRNA synthetase